MQNALVFEQACDNAMRDTLTGLANTRALQSHVTRELDRARRAGSQFSLVLLDLDDFKGINDQHGHLSGDRALQEVANALRERHVPTTSACATAVTSSSSCSRQTGARRPSSSAAACRTP